MGATVTFLFAFPTHRQLRCEPLEDRRMLAIVVNSYIDHSDGNISDSIISLRDAVQLAPPGETIEFDDVSRIELTLGPLPIRQDLTIRRTRRRPPDDRRPRAFTRI